MFSFDLEKRIPKKGSSLPDVTFRFPSSSSSTSSSTTSSSSTSSSSSNRRGKGRSGPSKKQKEKAALESEILRAFFACPLPTSPSKSSDPSPSFEASPSSDPTTSSLSPDPSSSSLPSSSSASPSSSPSSSSLSPNLDDDDYYSSYEPPEMDDPFADRSYPPSSSIPFSLLYEEASSYELSLCNFKRSCSFQRSKSSTKHPKINPSRYVNSWEKKREEAQESYEEQVFQAAKFNRQLLLAKELSLLNHLRIQARASRALPAHPFPQSRQSSSRRARAANQGQPGAPAGGEYINSRDLHAMARTYGVTPQIMEEIQKLQWKPNLTPEDYELLLLLDQAIKPKTISKATISSFPTRTLLESEFLENKVEGACPICIAPYLVGDEVKTLPCGHFFHSHCIGYWLLNSSTKCPSDGLPVME